MSTRLSNKFRDLLPRKVIDFANDTFKIILMAEGFVFNPSSHDTYALVIASELTAGYGYLQGNKTLTGVALTRDDTGNVCNITWNNVTWTATAGDIGPVCGAIIYDDTITSPCVDPVVGFIDFGGSFTEPDGGIATVSNPKVVI
jgi:hypothetical protein